MELLPRPPVRQLFLVCDLLAQQESILGGLLQRGEIPIGLELVRRLVVVLAVVLLVQPVRRSRPACPRIRWRAPIENAGMPAWRKKNGRSGNSGPARAAASGEIPRLSRLAICWACGNGGSLGAGDHHSGAAPGIKRVVVQIDGCLGRRNERMRGVVFRAASARLPRPSPKEQRGAPRLLRQRRPGARQFQQNAAAGGVIDGAVVDRIALHRRADPKWSQCAL